MARVRRRGKISKGGTRSDLGFYCRSLWEANIARYFNFLLKNGGIRKWQFEPTTFWFTAITHGPNMSYRPDFKVIENNGEIIFYEVKGFMDQGSRIKLKRMAKYYPEIKIVVIDKKQYYAIARKVSRLIPNWEIGERRH